MRRQHSQTSLVVQKKSPPCFDHVLKELSLPHERLSAGYLPLRNLLEEPLEREHPLAKICEKAVNMILNTLLRTRVAIMSAKVTNTYSRLGGAYLVRCKKKNTNLGDRTIAVFPIYATTQSEDGEVERLVSGFIVRGPQHTRNTTDKIDFLSVEILSKNDQTKTFVNYYKF